MREDIVNLPSMVGCGVYCFMMVSDSLSVVELEFSIYQRRIFAPSMLVTNDAHVESSTVSEDGPESGSWLVASLCLLILTDVICNL